MPIAGGREPEVNLLAGLDSELVETSLGRAVETPGSWTLGEGTKGTDVPLIGNGKGGG